MRRKPLAAVLALLSAALVLCGNTLLDAGWGSALRSITDRVLPNPEIAMWAPAPEPGSHASSYADATGSGANYVYLVDAADDDKVNIKIDDRATASHPMPLPLSLLPRYRFFAYFG